MAFNKVESKYKNPDKYIEKLKTELHFKQGAINIKNREIEKLNTEKESLKQQAYGTKWFEYDKDGARIGVNLISAFEPVRSGRYKVGTEVICFGKISDLTVDEKKTEAGIKIQKVFAKQ